MALNKINTAITERGDGWIATLRNGVVMFELNGWTYATPITLPVNMRPVFRARMTAISNSSPVRVLIDTSGVVTGYDNPTNQPVYGSVTYMT